MRIKLSANSIEAKEYISNLGNNNCSYAYYYGSGLENELDENSWSLKLFSTIENFFFKENSLPENRKEIINHIHDSANILNNLFDRDNYRYIDEMKISLNVDSGFNNWLKNNAGIFSLILPHMGKVKIGLLRPGASANSEMKQIHLNVKLFDKESVKEYPFMKEITEKLSLEDTIKLILYHEAAHSFHQTNIENKKISWEDGISNFLFTSEKLVYKNYFKRWNQKLIEGTDQEVSILCFIDECLTLEREIYADVGSLLLLRNDYISKGSYPKEEMHKYVDALILARSEENYNPNYFNDFSSGISSFNHNTVCGLEYFKSIMDTLPDRIINSEEINSICNKSSKIGVSRILLISDAIKEDYREQFKFIFNVEYNEENKTLFLPKEVISSKVENFWENIKETAGIQWYENFLDKVNQIDFLITVNESKTTWYAGTNPLGYKKDIEYHNLITSQIDEEHLKIKDNIQIIKDKVSELYYEKYNEYHDEINNSLNKNFAQRSINKFRKKFADYATGTSKLKNNS